MTNSTLPTPASTTRPVAGRQFSLRTMLGIMTALAFVYACLRWFGEPAHVVVWSIFLVLGPTLGMVLGATRLRERAPVVNSLQGGALGGAAGFLTAFLVLSPAYLQLPVQHILAIAVSGAGAAFTAGGVLGSLVGVSRAIVSWLWRTGESHDYAPPADWPAAGDPAVRARYITATNRRERNAGQSE